MTNMRIKLSNELFKFKTDKINRLRSGKLSVEAFVLTLSPNDPYMLIKDTVYALTEAEFTNIHGIDGHYIISDNTLDFICNKADLTKLTKKDQDFISFVKKDTQNCPTCRKRRYKDAIINIIKKYNIELPEKLSMDDFKESAEIPQYPETTGKIEPMVSNLMRDLYSRPKMPRRPCIDCVEKHISQAWILGNEAIMGYPEHIALVLGHLAEAWEETPIEMEELRRTIEFCMAKTNATRKPFVALDSLLRLINRERAAMQLSGPGRMDETNADADYIDTNLDITDDIIAEIQNLDDELREHMKNECNRIDFILEVENQPLPQGTEASPSKETCVAWEGSMSCLADSCASVAPLTANMLRNRRLMFCSAPDLAKKSGYNLDDLYKALTQK